MRGIIDSPAFLEMVRRYASKHKVGIQAIHVHVTPTSYLLVTVFKIRLLQKIKYSNKKNFKHFGWNILVLQNFIIFTDPKIFLKGVGCQTCANFKDCCYNTEHLNIRCVQYILADMWYVTYSPQVSIFLWVVPSFHHQWKFETDHLA